MKDEELSNWTGNLKRGFRIESMKIEDEFRGDNALLCESIEALIRLNDDGALVPHGIGGHARCLLAACFRRLSKQGEGAIRYVGTGPSGPHVIYLREGKRITIGRDRTSKGRAWLVIEETPAIRAQRGGVA